MKKLLFLVFIIFMTNAHAGCKTIKSIKKNKLEVATTSVKHRKRYVYVVRFDDGSLKVCWNKLPQGWKKGKEVCD